MHDDTRPSQWDDLGDAQGDAIAAADAAWWNSLGTQAATTSTPSNTGTPGATVVISDTFSPIQSLPMPLPLVRPQGFPPVPYVAPKPAAIPTWAIALGVGLLALVAVAAMKKA